MFLLLIRYYNIYNLSISDRINLGNFCNPENSNVLIIGAMICKRYYSRNLYILSLPKKSTSQSHIINRPLHSPNKENSLVKRYGHEEETRREDSLHHRDDQSTVDDELRKRRASLVAEILQIVILYLAREK